MLVEYYRLTSDTNNELITFANRKFSYMKCMCIYIFIYVLIRSKTDISEIMRSIFFCIFVFGIAS